MNTTTDSPDGTADAPSAPPPLSASENAADPSASPSASACTTSPSVSGYARSGPSSPALAPVPVSKYFFVPVDGESADAEANYANANAQLLELIIHAESPDCPDRSLRHADGNYHTGDLFLEVAPGRFVYRGRNDDWIKSENSLRCDTKAIEDHVLSTCADLVAACIVTGNGRPSPALFVEPADPGADGEKLKRAIVRRIRPFHDRCYMHERIMSAKFVVVVPAGTLPRTATKGNIRRRAVEEAFKAQLDVIYGVAH